MSQLKIQVLAIGPVQSGKSRAGNPWQRRILQCFTGEVVGNIPYFAEQEELERLAPGHYMMDVAPEAGDRGSLQFRIGKLTPIVQGKPAQAA